MHEFNINKYITLRLEDGITKIYVGGDLFKQCTYILIDIPVDEISSLKEIKSIDEAVDHLDDFLEGESKLQIPPETEFWGHCSNLQVWVENDYDTRLLHRNLAFPLLKKLTELGDPKAKHVFKEEIAKRFSSGNLSVITYLINEGYIKFLSEEELELTFHSISDFKEIILTILNKDLLYPFEVLLNFLLKIKKLVSREFFVNLNKEMPHDIKLMYKDKLVRNWKELNWNPDKGDFQYELYDLLAILDQDMVNNKDYVLVNDEKFFIINNTLKLSNCKIKQISNIEGLCNYTNLEYLYLSGNNIQEIEGLNSLENLLILDLSNNGITELKGLCYLQNLKYLDLSYNPIKKIEGLETLKDLMILILSGNYIEEIEGLENLSNLKYLDLSNTRIKKIENVESLKNLKILKLNDSLIPNDILHSLKGINKCEVENPMNPNKEEIPKKEKLTEEKYREIYNIFKKISISRTNHTFEQFKSNLDKFFELTIDAYVGGEGSRDVAISKWIYFIGSDDIAMDYFRAVDTWHAYS